MENLLVPWIGSQIREILEVIVYIGDEEIALPDTIVIVFDEDLIQVSIDPEFVKHVNKINSIDDAIIYGDYDDRTSVEFRKIKIDGLPFTMTGCHEVYESIMEKDYLIGIFLLSDAKGEYRQIEKIALSINLHLDDVEIGEKGLLLEYIGAIMTNSSKITINRCFKAQSDA